MALKEQDIVFTGKDADGNTIIQMPITCLANVEGLADELKKFVRSVNGSSVDDTGSVVIDDYITELSVLGKVITYKKKDGTTGTITTQDTNTTYSEATQSAQGLMSAVDKKKLDGIASGAQVNAVTSVNGQTGAVTVSAQPSLNTSRAVNLSVGTWTATEGGMVFHSTDNNTSWGGHTMTLNGVLVGDHYGKESGATNICIVKKGDVVVTATQNTAEQKLLVFVPFN